MIILLVHAPLLKLSLYRRKIAKNVFFCFSSKLKNIKKALEIRFILTSRDCFQMVVPVGIEPTTQGFSVLCSTDWATEPFGCGRRIWTNDLRVMSPTSYQTALSRDIYYNFKEIVNLFLMAEELGFEPRRRSHDLPVFKTGPFSHLGIPPYSI